MRLFGRHPFVLLIYLMGNLLVTMLTSHPVLLGISFIMAAITGSMLCGKQIWRRSLLLFLPLFFFAAVFLPLFSHNGVTPLFYINSQAITLESIRYGVVMSVMLVTIYMWFQVGSKLLDGEKLFYLFGRIAPSFGLLISMVFRMLPLLRNRFREIREAQKGLGLHEADTGVINRCRWFGREFSILISWSLENSVETAVSMESRGYGTGRRTSFHLFRVHRADVVFVIVFSILFGITIGVAGMGGYEIYYFPAFHMAAPGFAGIVGIVTFVMSDILALLIEGDIIHE